MALTDPMNVTQLGRWDTDLADALSIFQAFEKGRVGVGELPPKATIIDLLQRASGERLAWAVDPSPLISFGVLRHLAWTAAELAELHQIVQKGADCCRDTFEKSAICQQMRNENEAKDSWRAVVNAIEGQLLLEKEK